MTTLPPELWLHVLESLRPSRAVALCPSDPRVRAILSFTLVSRATYTVAVRCLFQHCLYIDSAERLRRLLLTLHAFSSRSEDSTLPHVDLAPCLTNLFLAPFPPHTIDDLPTAQWTYELLSVMSGTLRRLVIDIPLRSLYPDEDHLNVRPKLRAAFQQLTALEEFTSSRDELYLSVFDLGSPPAEAETLVWAGWSKLKKLALYNVALGDPRMAPSLEQLSSLDCLVLTRADDLDRESFHRTILPIAAQRDMKTLIVNVAADHALNGFSPGRMSSGVSHPVEDTPVTDHKLELGVVIVEPSKRHMMNGDILDCQEWIRDTALAGELWDWESNWSLELTESWNMLPGESDDEVL
ncbi:uncharacterized protein K452DRAFT_358511 [Aplosporella prunicola CBS 121167]|uniref:F-box domain-containing protein n=1 Tax=Aplosporella prunicola CBS 121167 TaxID=1176127 RepID=A0A6A6BD16_9PEZI|nr:uncharacterized protein K452DRAFT_358511 [Aplosporella prunicola CBS 121167]KAF2142040.1 hypothetical protein K452DRAFT_358511 [Aplosporella prunicola CBS 121167]